MTQGAGSTQRRKLRGTVVVLATLAATLVPPLASAAAPTNSESLQSFSDAFVNPCTGQYMTVSGTYHALFMSVTDEKGGFHYRVMWNFVNSSATDANGTVYRLTAVDPNTSINNTGVPPSEFTVAVSLAYVSEGAAPNWHLRFLYHITVDANGDITSSFNTVTSICK